FDCCFGISISTHTAQPVAAKRHFEQSAQRADGIIDAGFGPECQKESRTVGCHVYTCCVFAFVSVHRASPDDLCTLILVKAVGIRPQVSCECTPWTPATLPLSPPSFRFSLCSRATRDHRPRSRRSGVPTAL